MQVLLTALKVIQICLIVFDKELIRICKPRFSNSYKSQDEMGDFSQQLFHVDETLQLDCLAVYSGIYLVQSSCGRKFEPNRCSICILSLIHISEPTRPY